MTRQNIRRSIQEIYDQFCQRSPALEFTLESIYLIFDIGNEVFLKNSDEEYEKLAQRPASNAPDIMDDEPFSFDRTMAIYQDLQPLYTEVNPQLIQRVFEVNSRFAWSEYKQKYRSYILDIYDEQKNDEYICYLAAVLHYDGHEFEKAIACLNRAYAQNNSCSMICHLRGLCYLQLGQMEEARSDLYQGLFLIELLQDVPPRMQGDDEIYPNYPLEYHTSADVIRSDIQKLDEVEDFYQSSVVPLLST